MTKQVLDVGNCQPDFTAIRSFLTSRFDCHVSQADDGPGTIDALRKQTYDLVLVNRKLDCDYSDGLEVIKTIKADTELCNTPVMLITNYEEHQDAAVAAGALRGFGKLQFDDSETIDRLRPVLNVK